ncbi:MAG: DUF5655 domain-containing protein [Vicinamibacterales bacterium]
MATSIWSPTIVTKSRRRFFAWSRSSARRSSKAGSNARGAVSAIPGHECDHCKQWVEAGQPHFLEVCVFLGRTVKAPQVRRVDRASKTKIVHIIQIKHRDEVEAPVIDWLREAYYLPGTMATTAKPTRATARPRASATKKRTTAQKRKVAR